MYAFQSKRLRMIAAAGGALAGLALVAGCSADNGGDDAPADDTTSEDTSTDTGASNDSGGTGETVVIGFSGPAPDHGWLGAISKAAIALGESEDDIDLRVAEGTNDPTLQISQVESLVNERVDVIVLLPTDGAALTEAAIAAMQAGVPVVNVDREFSSNDAARVTILGDNYGMGVSAGKYICERLDGVDNPIIGEIAGIDALQLTTDRTNGFNDALADCGMSTTARVAAEFTVASGQEVTASLLSANPKFDAIWNHDDDQGIGVLAAINEAGRDEFFMVGGAGSLNAMNEIQDPDSVLWATVLYPSTQAADGILLARALVQGSNMGELASPGIPKRVVLYAPVVTADNVDEFIHLGFES